MPSETSEATKHAAYLVESDADQHVTDADRALRRVLGTRRVALLPDPPWPDEPEFWIDRQKPLWSEARLFIVCVCPSSDRDAVLRDLTAIRDRLGPEEAKKRHVCVAMVNVKRDDLGPLMDAVKGFKQPEFFEIVYLGASPEDEHVYEPIADACARILGSRRLTFKARLRRWRRGNRVLYYVLLTLTGLSFLWGAYKVGADVVGMVDRATAPDPPYVVADAELREPNSSVPFDERSSLPTPGDMMAIVPAAPPGGAACYLMVLEPAGITSFTRVEPPYGEKYDVLINAPGTWTLGALYVPESLDAATLETARAGIERDLAVPASGVGSVAERSGVVDDAWVAIAPLDPSLTRVWKGRSYEDVKSAPGVRATILRTGKPTDKAWADAVMKRVQNLSPRAVFTGQSFVAVDREEGAENAR